MRLAAKSNLSEGTIRDLESGKRQLRAAKVAAIRRALELAGVPFTELQCHFTIAKPASSPCQRRSPRPRQGAGSVLHTSLRLLRGRRRHLTNKGRRHQFRLRRKKACGSKPAGRCFGDDPRQLILRVCPARNPFSSNENIQNFRQAAIARRGNAPDEFQEKAAKAYRLCPS
ncbi:hypothetical protein AB6802_13085 [Mesorhizobium sp. RCC_202]